MNWTPKTRGNIPFKMQLNINGTELSLKSGTKISDIKSEEAKLVANIFDSNQDGILQKDELKNTDFKAGVFTVHLGENKKSVHYTEDTDNNGKQEYTSDWFFDSDDKLVERTRDIDGDGNNDLRSQFTYHANGNLASESLEIYTPDGKTLVEKTKANLDEDGYWLNTVEEITYDERLKLKTYTSPEIGSYKVVKEDFTEQNRSFISIDGDDDLPSFMFEIDKENNTVKIPKGATVYDDDIKPSAEERENILDFQSRIIDVIQKQFGLKVEIEE